MSQNGSSGPIEKWPHLKKKPLELVVVQGGGRGERHSLTAPRLILGRLDPNESPAFGNLLFPEPTVSRVHATLDWDEAANRYLLTHRSVTNPTLVNKIRISQPRHISPGDKIQMGNLILEIRVGIGQHAEVELATVDFTALTKRAANQVYRPETVMPEAPPVPAAGTQAPQESPAPIPAPIPPPSRRNLPAPVFQEPYAPVLREAPNLFVEPFFDFPEADEQVSHVQLAPRRILLSSLPREDEHAVEPTPVKKAQAPAPVLRLAPEIPKVELEDEWVVIEDSVEPKVLEPLVPAIEANEEMAEKPQTKEQPASGTVAEGLAVVDHSPEQEAAEALTEELSTEELPTKEEAAAALAVELTTEEAAKFEPLEIEKPKPTPVRRDMRKVGRNEKCPCGSGKKYKKCCGATSKK